MKKILIFLFLFSIYNIFSEEELVGAKELLEKISKNFKTNIKSFEANLKWYINDDVQEGVLFFKNPQKLRINFTNPATQVFCTNGYELWFFIPANQFVLHQELMKRERKIVDTKNNPKDNKSNKDNNNKDPNQVDPILITPVGLDKFIEDYSVEFNEGVKSKVDYKNSKVYKFKLDRWRSSANGYNRIYLTVEESGIIRKVEGITAAFRKITIEYDDVKLNNSFSDLLFDYEPPAHVRTIDNFILNQGEMD